MPHIVVAESLKEHHGSVASRAAPISRSMEADLRLLHVLPEIMPPLMREPRRQRAQECLSATSSALARKTGRRVTYKVTEGDICGRILRESEDHDTVLTIIGQGKGGSSRFLPTGGVAMRCLARARNAVLLVCGGTAENGYQRALIAQPARFDEDRLLPYMAHVAPHAAVHRFEAPSGRKVGEHVAAMRRAVDADLLVVGIPRDESLNPFRFRRLPTQLARAPECDTLFVPHVVTTIPPEAAVPVRLRAAV